MANERKKIGIAAIAVTGLPLMRLATMNKRHLVFSRRVGCRVSPQRRPLHRQPDDDHLWSLIMLAVMLRSTNPVSILPALSSSI